MTKQLAKEMNNEIAITGTGYTGLSNAVLLAQHNEVVVLDIAPEKVDMINRKHSPIEDAEIEDYLSHRTLNLKATHGQARSLYDSLWQWHRVSGWLNTDIIASGPSNYVYVNLVERHPFPDNSFAYTFSEDFIEYMDQAASMIFLIEAYRTLTPGVTLRITTPDLAKVHTKHYREKDFKGFEIGRDEAYSIFGHLHFYSQESLRTVAS